MSKDHGFLRCYASDEVENVIPKIRPLTSDSLIMNMDVSIRPVTHWIAVYWTPTSLKYYNPLGDALTESFREQAKDLAKAINLDGFLRFKVNHIQRQSNTSDTRGYHSMKFIKDREAGQTFAQATGYEHHKKDDHVH